MGGLVLDVREAMRLHVRRPMFAVVAVAVLGVAIGAATAVFDPAELLRS